VLLQDYEKSGIYMTAVDTGWINDEKPMGQVRSMLLSAPARTTPAPCGTLSAIVVGAENSSSAAAGGH
jgi:hypothetical protein